MDPSIRRAALRAAAKVAISAAVTGCGGSGETPNPVEVALSDASQPLDATLDARLDASASDAKGIVDRKEAAVHDAANLDGATACESGPAPIDYPLDASVPDDLVSCCAAVVFPHIPDGGYWIDESGMASLEVLTCCTQLVPAYNMGTPKVPYEVNFACCVALDWGESKACSAWGPPVPPAFDATVDPGLVLS